MWQHVTPRYRSTVCNSTKPTPQMDNQEEEATVVEQMTDAVVNAVKKYVKSVATRHASDKASDVVDALWKLASDAFSDSAGAEDDDSNTA